MIPGIDEIKSLAVKYSKKELANMAQLGLVDPQKAVMAGMMRDRISKEDMQPPQTTVAQDILGAPATPTAQPQMGQAQPPQMPQAQPPQMGAPVQQPPQMAASGGLTSLPVDVKDYAGGGIVAFADGGDTYSGKLWEELPSAEREPRFASDYITNMFTPSGRRLDPVTGEEISLVQFLERAQKERAGPSQASYPAQQWKDVTTNVEKAQADKKQMPPAADRGPAFPGGVSTRGGMPAYNPNLVKVPVSKFDVPEVRQIGDITKERQDIERQAGVDPELYANMIKGVEEKKGKLEGKKGESKGMGLMQLGLGLIGARRGQEFQALGESGAKALAAYKQDVKDLDAASEKYDERMEALRIADQQAKKTNSSADIATRDKEREKAAAARAEQVKAENEAARTGAQVGAQVYSAQLSAQTQKEIANMNAGVQKWVHSRPPAEIQAIDIYAQRTGKKFEDAMKEFYAARQAPKQALTREDALKIVAQSMPMAKPEELNAAADRLMSGTGNATAGWGKMSVQ